MFNILEKGDVYYINEASRENDPETVFCNIIKSKETGGGLPVNAPDTAKEDRRQEIFSQCIRAKAETKKEKKTNFLVFLLLIPGISVGTVLLFLQYTGGILPGILLGAVIPAGSFFLCSARNKAAWRRLTENPAMKEFAETMNEMHSELLEEAFGMPVQVRPDAVVQPGEFDPGMPAHLYGLKERNWDYTLWCCTKIPYRNGAVKLCSMKAVEPGDDDGPGMTLKGIYAVVHTPGKISIPHDPLHITRRRIPADENGETGKFQEYYTGTRKTGPLGRRETVDSVPAVSGEVGNAIMNFERKGSRHRIQEAWIRGRGIYYFRLTGPLQNETFDDDYRKTADIYRDLYGRIRKLADACFDTTEADLKITGMK